MEESVSRSDVSAKETTRHNVAYVWIAVAFVVLVGAIAFVMVRTDRNTRERATAQEQTPPPDSGESSTLIEFAPEDVQVNTGWTLLAGRHPTVKFTCGLAPAVSAAKLAVLCYRPCGSSEWLSVEARPRRDRTCHVTLRDLSRNMPYECFFIVSTGDSVIQSGIVRFHTITNNP